MADKSKGFVKIFRSLQDHWLWTSKEPFDKRSAWVDLLLLANHKSGKLLIRGDLLQIRPGQHWTSKKQLMERWHWSEHKLNHFFDLLQRDGMIDVYTDKKTGTLITLKRWEQLSGNGGCDDGSKTLDFIGVSGGGGVSDGGCDGGCNDGSDGGTNGGTDGGQTRMIKNVKNDKEGKNKNPAPPHDGGEWQ